MCNSSLNTCLRPPVLVSVSVSSSVTGRILPVVFCGRGLLPPPPLQQHRCVWECGGHLPCANAPELNGTHVASVCVRARERLVQDTCLRGVLCACRTLVPTQCTNMQHAHTYFTVRHRWPATDTAITHVLRAAALGGNRERAAGEWSCVCCISCWVSLCDKCRPSWTPLPPSLLPHFPFLSLPPSLPPPSLPLSLPLPSHLPSLSLPYPSPSSSPHLSIFPSSSPSPPPPSLPVNDSYGLREYYNSLHFSYL